jgi:hypothetical protein
VNFTSRFNFKTNQFTFVNTNVTSKKSAYSVGSASSLMTTVSNHFTTWLNSRSPATFKEVVDTFYLGANEVKLLEKKGTTSKFFKRREGESNVEFQKRVEKKTDEDKILENPETKICYFGNAEELTDDVTKQWPADSLVIAKYDPKLPSNVIWTTDPYSVFN